MSKPFISKNQNEKTTSYLVATQVKRKVSHIKQNGFKQYSCLQQRWQTFPLKTIIGVVGHMGSVHLLNFTTGA